MRSYNLKKADYIQRVKQFPDFVEITYPDGGYYIGQVSDNKLRNGQGIYTYPTGEVYFGGWKD
jgi:hypothetical protein